MAAKNNVEKVITFDGKIKGLVLDSFGKTIDSDGLIVEKINHDQKVMTDDGEEICESHFAGIRKGSQVFIKSDILSIVRLAELV